MALAGFSPLVIVAVVVVVLTLSRASDRAGRWYRRVALGFFAPLVDPAGKEHRVRVLRSAYVGTAYRAYAAETLLSCTLVAIAGSVIGVYLAVAALTLVPAFAGLVAGLPGPVAAALPPAPPFLPSGRSVPRLAPGELFAVEVVGSVAVAVLAAAATYHLKWRLPAARADKRATAIDASMARTVAFTYALSRGGMAFPAVLRTLARNRGVYGSAADEVAIAVRNMDLFGTDAITAVREMAGRSPSEGFRRFGENLASVLQSGQNLSGFLRDQYERYQEEARELQAEIMERLSTIAQMYVTILVAGVLFLLTILVIIGLTVRNTLWLVGPIAYVAIPAANVGFMWYLANVTEAFRVGRARRETGVEVTDWRLLSDRTGPGDAARADGGVRTPEARANLERLRVYKRFETYWSMIRRPLASLRRKPSLLLYLTVPLAVAWIAWHTWELLPGGIEPRALDDPIVQGALFVLATFGLVRWFRVRRLERIEEAMPDLLDRLASLNEAGMTVVESHERVRTDDLGPLGTEVRCIWADVQWGARVETALRRFERRVNTPSATRMVTLVTNAMHASGDIGPVLRIAADRTRADRRMKRLRRQEMFTYVVVIYVAFAVFLVIIVAIAVVLVPSLPTREALSAVANPGTAASASVPTSGRASTVPPVAKEAYTLVFFHAALVQAVFSGFVAGQMGEGAVRDGAKHAAILLAVAYAAFILLP